MCHGIRVATRSFAHLTMIFAKSRLLVAVHIYVHVIYLKKRLPLDSIVLLDNDIMGGP